jgi:hypothetical protein
MICIFHLDKILIFKRKKRKKESNYNSRRRSWPKGNGINTCNTEDEILDTVCAGNVAEVWTTVLCRSLLAARLCISRALYQ